METSGKSLIRKLDWLLISVTALLVIFGWMNIYSALNVENSTIFDLSQRYGMHFIWIVIATVVDVLILFVIPEKFWSAFSWWSYLLMIGALLAVLVVGTEIKGSKSWINFGSFSIQPAEFSKITTSLALAALMSKYGFNFKNFKDGLSSFALIGLMMGLILLEHETGLMLVYLAFIFVFYREGMSGWVILLGALAILLFILTLIYNPFVSLLVAYGIILSIVVLESKKPNTLLIPIAASIALLSFLPQLLEIDFIAAHNPFSAFTWLSIILVAASLFFLIRIILRKLRLRFLRNALISMICCICLIYSVDFIFNKVLGDHQRARIEVLLGIKEDPSGVGYNVHQSMVAIGSGQFFGKGFLNGTQTRFNFVPEQETDFIFCTVGEEWGFFGALLVLIAYFFIITRIINSADKSKDNYTRIYGYCVAMCLTMHVVINIAMTIGLMPVIGIPLPFLSYGGSSLLAFSILLFIFIRLDAERK